MSNDSSAIDFEALGGSGAGRSDDLTSRLRAKSREVASSDSLKHVILNMVASQNYDMARDTLTAYIEDRREFPIFQERVQRYVNHGLDLIQAIELKRNFPGINSLAFAKQQEIHEGVMKHFEELKHTLTSIQKTEREHKLQDLRSTVWFLNTLSYCLFVIVTVGFVLALSHGLGYSFYVVLESIADKVSSFLVGYV